MVQVKGIAYIPVQTASRQLSVSRQRVYQLIEGGKLVAIEMDKTVLVSQESVTARIDAIQGRLFDGAH